MSRLKADALLLITGFLWGVTFVAQKDAVGTIPPLAYVAARFLVSAGALAPLALWERGRARTELGPREWRIALVMALSLFLGSSLQQAGLETTSATNGGFLTACYVVLTVRRPGAVADRRGPSSLRRVLSRSSALGCWRRAATRRSRRQSATGSCSSPTSPGRWGSR